MRTYNVKLFIEDSVQRESLLHSLRMNLEAWNIISKYRFSMRGGRIKILHDNTYKKVKEQVLGIPSQYIIKAIRDVIAAYKTIKQNQHKLEEPAVKKNLSMHLDKRIYNWIDSNTIRIATHTRGKQAICKFDIYPKLKEMFDNGKGPCRDPSIFVRDGNIYLSLIFDDDRCNDKKRKDNKKVLGIDLGIRRLTATSDGHIIKGNEFNGHKRRIRYNKRKLQAKSKNSSHSARTKLNKLKRKERNFSKNYTHHVVNEVLKTKAHTIVLEDLSQIKENTKHQGRRHNNMLSQVPFYMFRIILTYKAQLFGKKVATVNPYYTSQMDHRGLIGGKRKGCRYYGVDGIVLDADVNAAINIAQKWKKENHYAKPSSKKHSVSCCCAALDGQVHVNGPIVLKRASQLDLSIGS